MNKTEERFAEHLGTLKLAGEVAWWRFEGMKLQLANDCWYTPDFNVQYANGELAMIDVKGAKKSGKFHATEDSKVKLRMAAEQYPMRFYVTWEHPRKSARDTAGGWDYQEYHGTTE